MIRGREFLMKDAYSFDLADEAWRATKHRARTADLHRLGLVQTVAAMSGAMGGRLTRSSCADAESARTPSSAARGGYAANVEAVSQPAPPGRPGPPSRREVRHARHPDDRDGRLVNAAVLGDFTAATR